MSPRAMGRAATKAAARKSTKMLDVLTMVVNVNEESGKVEVVSS
jgi:hypothetical protein